VVALWSDAAQRRWLVLAGQSGLAAALLVTAWSHSAWGLSIGLALAGAASGVACGAAQAMLLAANGQTADRVMLRWTLFAAVGDVLTPMVAASAIAFGFSYRGAMVAIAVLVAAQCAGMARLAAEPRGRREPPATGPAQSLASALAVAVRHSRLWVWLFAAASCTLLDEIVVALVALWLERDQGLSDALAAAAPVTFCVGSVLGVALTDSVVARLGGRGVLIVSGVLCALAIAAILAPRHPLLSCIALFLVGVTCAPHHALAMARAYDELPDSPGTVQAIAQWFVLVDVLAPLALGFVADRFGLSAAIASLVLQPAVIVVCACLVR
jgi:MFS transporter, FSR family, fosmidomycin resistance protein